MFLLLLGTTTTSQRCCASAFLLHHQGVVTDRPSRLYSSLFSEEHRRLIPSVSEDAWNRLDEAARALMYWNDKINVISRKDFDATVLVERHYLPSLALLNIEPFRNRLAESSVTVLDAGTGGGFPGLPLAIACPNVEFTLADGRGKKIQVVDACARAAAATNAIPVHARVPEDVSRGYFDFVLGRAVTALPGFVPSVAPSLRRRRKVKSGDEGGLDNGIVYIKGGKFDDEIAELGLRPLHDYSLTDLLSHKTKEEDEKRVLFFGATDVLRHSR